MTQISRRRLIGGAAVTSAAYVAGSALRPTFAFAATGTAPHTLVLVILRGGLDGVSAVVPIHERGYYDTRRSTAIAANRTVALDGQFGLHPGLRALAPIYQSRELAIVHAVGSPLRSRSHFVQQDFLERAGTPSGWLTGLLRSRASRPAPRGIALAPQQPKVVASAPGLIASPDLGHSRLWPETPRRVEAAATLGRMYGGSLLAGQAVDAITANAALGRISLGTSGPAALGYDPTDLFHMQLHQAAQVIRDGPGLEAVVLELDGFDMHAGAGNVDSGHQRRMLERVGNGLAAFHGEVRAGAVTTVVLSEFGRRIAENGSGGTDHGSGGVAFVLGRGLRGGAVYSRWPGLDKVDLDDGDLRVTSDFRDVVGEVLRRRVGRTNLASVFPGYTVQRLGICA
jgi:uncharacterized protein (DUF1501 family)